MGKGRGIRYRLPLWLMFVAGLFGGLVLYGPGAGFDSHHYSYLRAGQRHLEDMELLLRKYKAAHGRYPTTDEGLAVLDGYASRFGIERTPTPYWPGPWKLLGMPWPTTEEKLRSLMNAGQVMGGDDDFRNPKLPGLEAGICESGYVYVLYHSEPLDMMSAPFIYENTQAGGKSCIPADRFGMFSRNADAGVRTASPGSRAIREWLWPWERAKIIFWSLLAVLGLWWGYGWLRYPAACPRARTIAWLVLALFLIVGGVWFVAATSCATTCIPIGEWSKEAAQFYRDTQAEMLQAGLISKETFHRRDLASFLNLALFNARNSLARPDDSELPAPPSTSAPDSTRRPHDANEAARP